MASLGELLAMDGFKNQEPKPPRAEVLRASRAISMPLHHAHGTDLLSPPANPRPGEGRTGSSGDHLPRGKSPAIGSRKENVNGIPGFGGGNFNAVQSRRLLRHNKGAAGVAPPLDEAATWALVSILSDHIGCFFKDENFRMFLRQRCYYCLRFVENGDDQNDSGSVAKLRDSIAIIERSAQEFPDRINLKKSCAQLRSIITAGLGSTALEGGFASGIPSSRLSACAHLYLSVICKMTKKDRASAEHLLQAFCDSPFEARTILLPDLWESLLLPHLHHLTAWYVEEAEGISGTPCRQIKMKLLERVHSDALDKGTYQIAAYYKGWVMGGMEAPSYPSICFPSPSFFVTSHGGSQSQVFVSPSSSASSRPLISRKLYESIFDRSTRKDVANEQEGVEEYWDDKLYCNCGGSSRGRDDEDDHETGRCSSRPMMRRAECKQENFPVCSSTMH